MPTDQQKTNWPHGLFAAGDRVRHLLRADNGEVKWVKGDVVGVLFDKRTPNGNESWGEYDAFWFRLHPNLLVKIQEHNSDG